MRILGTHHFGKELREAFTRRGDSYEVFCWHDYAEQVVYSFAHQIKFEYYGGNISVSIDVILLDHFISFQNPSPLLSSGDLKLQDLFHSFFSDGRKQDSFTKSAFSKHIIESFQNRQLCFVDLSNIWENKDGCEVQYRCATALFLLSMLSHMYNIIIDCDVGAPGNIREVARCLNATDK